MGKVALIRTYAGGAWALVSRELSDKSLVFDLRVVTDEPGEAIVIPLCSLTAEGAQSVAERIVDLVNAPYVEHA